jgi:hypothetical protein
MKVLGYVFATISVMVIGVTLSGFVLSILWSWFISPSFNVDDISVPVAIGISMIVSYMTYQDDSKSDTNKSKEYSEILTEYAGKSLGRPLFALLFGWIVTLFI